MSKLREPSYLNLEYWFNEFFELIRAILKFLFKFLEWLSGFNLRFISILVSLLLMTGVIYLLCRIIRLQKKKIVDFIDFFAEDGLPEARSARWEEIKKHMESENPIDWKMAVIEADALMEDIIKRIGYKGDNLGERLKRIEPSDFDNLQNVWKAHKIRNRLVHEPGKIEFTKDESKNTIEKYEKALKELKYI